MKKFLKSLLTVTLVLVFAFLITGCSKEETIDNSDKATDKKDTKEKSVTDDLKLYSDDTKLVFKYSDDYFMVFYYSGNEITGLEHYYHFSTNEMKEYFRSILDSTYNEGDIVSITEKSDYLIVKLSESEYSDYTVETIKQLYSAMEQLK